MCLITFAWQAHARWPLIVAANRDEWRARPAAPLAEWQGEDVIAGRDRQAGGTWMGLTRSGRFAALTNVREPSQPRPGAPSRGALVTDFLRGHDTPHAHVTGLAAHAAEYQSYNLLAGDLESIAYFGSPRREALLVPPGVHGLSNDRLDVPWPKVTRTTRALEAALSIDDEAALAETLFAMLSDRTLAPDADLPDTGVGLELERRLSPVMLLGDGSPHANGASPGDGYGTRCSSVILRDARGGFASYERTRDETGAVVHEAVVR